MTDDPLDPLFNALADATRRDVLRFLSSDGELTATALAGRLPVTRQAVAKHLSALEAAGLVQAYRAGRELRYRITPRPLADAMGWMAEVGAEWDDRLERLRRHLNRPR